MAEGGSPAQVCEPAVRQLFQHLGARPLFPLLAISLESVCHRAAILSEKLSLDTLCDIALARKGPQDSSSSSATAGLCRRVATRCLFQPTLRSTSDRNRVYSAYPGHASPVAVESQRPAGGRFPDALGYIAGGGQRSHSGRRDGSKSRRGVEYASRTDHQAAGGHVRQSSCVGS